MTVAWPMAVAVEEKGDDKVKVSFRSRIVGPDGRLQAEGSVT